ncbi:hypothetical protein [Arthrobacter sp. MMS18-M83]|uniref:hypothetical protein n=1 Tax=Arthrobacter sp. MMS18-M83 TaxID=2996261 RepID=UPI00227A6F2F|nr:hypothetical protein [Arthrobacter sp. MMS18-M83]WAH95909.1 hypothetical protein OW521_15885 [Arthrobacter sp. MMS18-M83]
MISGQEHRVATLASNSGANVLRSVASSLLTVALPFLLARLLSAQAYSAWVLLFGMAAYVIYFDLGLQPVVQSMVARFVGTNDRESTRDVVGAALRLMGLVVICCLPVACIVSAAIKSFFPGLPDGVLVDFQIAFVVTVCGQLAILISNVVMAYHAGKQQLVKPSFLVGASRLGALLGAAAAAAFTNNLTVTSIALTLPLLIGLGILIWRLRGNLAEYRGSLREPMIVRYLG